MFLVCKCKLVIVIPLPATRVFRTTRLWDQRPGCSERHDSGTSEVLYVPHTPLFIHGTLYENLIYGVSGKRLGMPWDLRESWGTSAA